MGNQEVKNHEKEFNEKIELVFYRKDKPSRVGVKEGSALQLKDLIRFYKQRQLEKCKVQSSLVDYCEKLEILTDSVLMEREQRLSLLSVKIKKNKLREELKELNLDLNQVIKDMNEIERLIYKLDSCIGKPLDSEKVQMGD